MPALAGKDERPASYGQKNRAASGSFDGLLRLGRASKTAGISGKASPAAWIAPQVVRVACWWSDGDKTASYNGRQWRLRERDKRDI